MRVLINYNNAYFIPREVRVNKKEKELGVRVASMQEMMAGCDE